LWLYREKRCGVYYTKIFYTYHTNLKTTAHGAFSVIILKDCYGQRPIVGMQFVIFIIKLEKNGNHSESSIICGIQKNFRVWMLSLFTLFNIHKIYFSILATINIFCFVKVILIAYKLRFSARTTYTRKWVAVLRIRTCFVRNWLFKTTGYGSCKLFCKLHTGKLFCWNIFYNTNS
jgi:hypothetical protein